MYFLPEYVMWALCHHHRSNLRHITWNDVRDMDYRCAVAYEELLGLDLLSRSQIMLIAFMSQFTQPEDSLPIAYKIYDRALKKEIIYLEAARNVVSLAKADRQRTIERLEGEIKKLRDVEALLGPSTL